MYQVDVSKSTPQSPPLSDTPVITRLKGPVFSLGAFCRVGCKSRDNIPLEATLIEVSDDNRSVKVKFFGTEETQSSAMKDIVPSRGRAARDAQVASFSGPSQPKIEWKVGDRCRAVYTEDKVEYDAIIESLQGNGPAGDGSLSAVIRYVDYGNTEVKSLSELKAMPEKPKVGDPVRALYSEDNQVYEATVVELGSTETGQDYCTVEFVGYLNRDTVWVNELNPSLGQEARDIQKSQAGQKTTKVGDFCRAIYQEDNQEYEGEIIDINKDEKGNAYCTVRFLGYDNEETAWLEDLKPSHGKEAREQLLALFDQVDEKAPKVVESQEPPKAIENNPTNQNNSWAMGSHCRAIYAEDGNEYEGEIIDINKDEKGSAYCTVRFLGYGNEETVWLQDLLQSKGEDERKKVLQMFEAPEAATEAKDDIAQEKLEKVKEDDTIEDKTDDKVMDKPKWVEGDFCSIISDNHGKTVRNLECLIETTDGSRVTLRILGLLNVFEHCTIDKLLPTSGSEAREKQVSHFMNISTSSSYMDNGPIANSPPAQTSSISINSFGDMDKITDMVNKLSLLLDNQAVIDDLKKQKDELREEMLAMHQQIEGLRRGNIELLKQLNSGGSPNISDTVEVAVRNLNAEKERYACLERKYQSKLETSTKDERRLLSKIEELKDDVSRLKREVLLVKSEKQGLLNGNISFKAGMVTNQH